ncbi:MAG: hypothetical protein HAW62_03005 [Endozoicomonadaceae bacterium]|nr:hypothetical protein [Endozoicomonadaceae bacterium]
MRILKYIFIILSTFISNTLMHASLKAYSTSSLRQPIHSIMSFEEIEIKMKNPYTQHNFLIPSMKRQSIFLTLKPSKVSHIQHHFSHTMKGMAIAIPIYF